jgi:hypothetical protein
VPIVQPIIADQHVLEVLGFAGGFAHKQDGGSGSNGVGDADEGFLRNVASARAGKSEDSSAQERERKADPLLLGEIRFGFSEFRAVRASGADFSQLGIERLRHSCVAGCLCGTSGA